MFGITTFDSTALPVLGAREDFGRARLSRLTAQADHGITRRDSDARVRDAGSSR